MFLKSLNALAIKDFIFSILLFNFFGEEKILPERILILNSINPSLIIFSKVVVKLFSIELIIGSINFSSSLFNSFNLFKISLEIKFS